MKEATHYKTFGIEFPADVGHTVDIPDLGQAHECRSSARQI